MPDQTDITIALLSLTCLVAAWRIGVLARRVAQLQAERAKTLAEIAEVRVVLDRAGPPG